MYSAPIAQTALVVADDNLFTRQLIRSALGGYGMRGLTEAREGFEALELVERQRPDILLVDERLPGLSGVELTRLIRKASGGVEFTPIIVMGGVPRREIVMAAIMAGAHEFIAKPFSPATLFARVEASLRHPRPFWRTKTFFGPVPYAPALRAHVLGEGVSEAEAFSGMSCAVRGGPVDPRNCPMGAACMCQRMGRLERATEVVAL